MENKDGLITHYINLNVQTKGTCRDMRFLVTNIGHKDIVLGYPWLSVFEPQFDWTHTVIHKGALPIVIQSVNPRIPGKDLIIAKAQSHETKIYSSIMGTHHQGNNGHRPHSSSTTIHYQSHYTTRIQRIQQSIQ